MNTCFLSSEKACIELLRSMVFVSHPEKSVLAPSKALEFLALKLNFTSMTVSLTEVKKIKIKKDSQFLRENKTQTCNPSIVSTVHYFYITES